MTATEFATAVLAIRDALVANFKTEMPSETEVIDRFILPGTIDESQWVAALRTDNVIRKLIVLMPQLDLGLLANTNAGANFSPQVTFGLELYHEYKVGTDSENTEEAFLEDASKVIYTLGKYRALPSQTLITRASLKLGIRPSKVQSLHAGKGSVTVDLRNLKYT